MPGPSEYGHGAIREYPHDIGTGRGVARNLVRRGVLRPENVKGGHFEGAEALGIHAQTSIC